VICESVVLEEETFLIWCHHILMPLG
jgi:hypothetical protein